MIARLAKENNKYNTQITGPAQRHDIIVLVPGIQIEKQKIQSTRVRMDVNRVSETAAAAVQANDKVINRREDASVVRGQTKKQKTKKDNRL